MIVFNPKIKKEIEEKRATDPIYDLKYRLMFAMREQIEVMAQHNDSDLSLFHELQTADLETLLYYKELYLND